MDEPKDVKESAPKVRRSVVVPPPVTEPDLSFEEFVLRAQVSTVWAAGFRLDRILRGGLSPRSFAAWSQALTLYQAQT